MSKNKMNQLTSPVKRLGALAALWIVGLFFPCLARWFPQVTEEVFSERLYVWISSAFGWLSSLAPISVSEIVLFALVIAVGVLAVLYVIRFVMRKTTLSGLLHGTITLFLTLGIALNAFFFMWGLNYSRPTLYTLMQLEMRDVTTDELFALCERLIDDANSERELIHTDDAGIFKLNSDVNGCFSRVCEAYAAAGEENPLIARPVYAAKPVSGSRLMSRAGISGVFVPVLTEANVNTDQPDIALPFTAAHENAHYLGFAREDEANFWAYVACSYSRDADIRYSGIVNALLYCLSAAREDAPERYDELTARLSEGVRADIENYSEYWTQYQGAMRDMFSKLNDSYLKLNDQQDGVLSYGGMVDLLLAKGAVD